VVTKYEQLYGCGSWKVAVDAYHHHIAAVDAVAPVLWMGPPLYCSPAEQLRLMDPDCPWVFYEDIVQERVYQLETKQRCPQLWTAWAQMKSFTEIEKDGIGKVWVNHEEAEEKEQQVGLEEEAAVDVVEV